MTKQSRDWIALARTDRSAGLFGIVFVLGCVGVCVGVAGTTVETNQPQAEETKRQPVAEAVAEDEQQPAMPHTVPLDLIPGTRLEKDRLVRLSRTDAVWLDKKSKSVIVAGSVCNRQGPLEMFACPRGTKEYESVVSVDSRAQIVHTALLAAGIKPGKPVVFGPEYQSASGPTIEITVVWVDEQTKKQQRVRAQQWVRHVASKQQMSAEWVFAGSGFWQDPDTGKEHYLAEGGELVCVSNFATATLDLSVSSPQANENLFFDAFTDRIPPQGTRVWLLMRESKTEVKVSK